MNILLLGSGGREHALAWKMAASPLVERLYCAPGNAGIAQEAEIVALDPGDHAAVIAFCKEKSIDLVVVGPEAPLCAGIVDDLEAAGIKAFGPSKAAARLEGSKGFTKDICRSNNIPTAAYERFTSAEQAKAYVRQQGAPIVVKADGLAAGKGVVVAETLEQALDAIDMMFEGGLGAAGAEVVIEEFLEGEEASFFALCDGTTAIAARVGAGSQARLRQRSGPEYRRHGRLFAGAGDDRGDDEAHDDGNHRADPARDGGDGCALQGRAVCRPDDHQGWSEADRIQCALRRSGNAGADAAADVGSGAGAARVARRRAEGFRSALVSTMRRSPW